MAKSTALIVFAVSMLLIGFAIGFNIARIISPATQHAAQPQPQSSAPIVKPLFDEEYYNALISLLDKANRSVHIVMFVVKYDPHEPRDPVNNVLRKLVELKSRGVDVKIVVDDETYNKHRETIRFLAENGIPIKLDESSARTTHAKIVVIDDRIVFVGSHNWTESALTKNHEASVCIDSEEIAERFERYFETIWENGRSVE